MSAKIINISGSYVQDQRHAKVSQRYNPIQASAVGQAMDAAGLSIVSLSTGRARHEDKKDFQRTLTRYRGPEVTPGVFLDIVYDSKHMGRGVDCIYVGIFRMVCTNGLFTGTSFFQHEVRHSGDTYANLNEGIAAALGMQTKLADMVTRMQGVILTPEQREIFARDAIKLLTPSDTIQVKHRLLKPNRESDASPDLWTTFNLIQENSVKGNNMVYSINSVDRNKAPAVRNMTARAIKPNSAKDLDFNQAFFDIALKLAA